jgi:hypothetical protein
VRTFLFASFHCATCGFRYASELLLSGSVTYCYEQFSLASSWL